MSALKKLEMFNGTGDVERFIDRFEFAAEMDDVENEKVASYLVMHLSGMAYDVWKGMKNSDKRDEDEIEKVLCATYGIRKPVAWRAMTTYCIHVGQQHDSASEELYKWAKIVTAGENPASTLAAVAFVEALPVHIAQKVRGGGGAVWAICITRTSCNSSEGDLGRC